jgi:hypothetical protein
MTAIRYPLSPRIQTLKAILGKIRPEPIREPLPPPKVYAPPRAAAAKRRGGEIPNLARDDFFVSQERCVESLVRPSLCQNRAHGWTSTSAPRNRQMVSIIGRSPVRSGKSLGDVASLAPEESCCDSRPTSKGELNISTGDRSNSSQKYLKFSDQPIWLSLSVG